MPPSTITTKSTPRGEYIETETGNKISRRATILGPKHIILAGKCVIQQDVVIHGDLVRPASHHQSKTSITGVTAAAPSPEKKAATTSAGSSSSQEQTSVHLGRYVFVSPGCTLHPPSRLATGSSSTTSSSAASTASTTQTLTYYPLRISDHVFIGPNCHIRAAEIRSNVYIGANCVIGNMCIIKDNVKILEGSVLPPNSVWTSFSIVAGNPARVIAEMGEGWGSGGAGGSSSGIDEGIGVRSRERWAAVGNKR